MQLEQQLEQQRHHERPGRQQRRGDHQCGFVGVLGRIVGILPGFVGVRRVVRPRRRQAASSSAASSESSAASSAATGTTSPYAPITGDPSKVKLGMAYDGPKGDMSFTDSASSGVEAAKAAGVNLVAELFAPTGTSEPDSAKSDRLQQLVDQGANTVVAVGFDYAAPMATVAAANPDVKFGIVDDNTQCISAADGGVKGGPIKNVTCLNFAAEQSSFLVGVAAALQTKTKHVAFIGGVDVPLLQTFQAGFDAGVKQADSSVKIDDKYITEPPDFTGFNAPDKGQTIAKGLYDGGADIIYAAAGGSGTGVFKAAQGDEEPCHRRRLRPVPPTVAGRRQGRHHDVRGEEREHRGVRLRRLHRGRQPADRIAVLRPEERRRGDLLLGWVHRLHPSADRAVSGEDHLGRDQGPDHAQQVGILSGGARPGGGTCWVPGPSR